MEEHNEFDEEVRKKLNLDPDIVNATTGKKRTKVILMKQASFLEALEKKYNNVSATCKMMGISRFAHYNWMENYLDYKERVESIPLIKLDIAEGILFKMVCEENESMVKFFLDREDKKNGNTGNITINIGGV